MADNADTTTSSETQPGRQMSPHDRFRGKTFQSFLSIWWEGGGGRGVGWVTTSLRESWQNLGRISRIPRIPQTGRQKTGK